MAVYSDYLKTKMNDPLQVILGDARHIPLANESVHCVVTSPPYWGLRDYGVDGQIGLENTPEAYVESMVELMREVRRVLRSDGTLWLNLGDTFFGGNWRGSEAIGTKQATNKGSNGTQHSLEKLRIENRNHPTLKAKDLIGIPWRVAFALQADGWWLRSDIIWNKPNPMPESVTDRPTKSHEYIFLLTKSERYFFDAEAVKEPAAYDGRKDTMMKGSDKYKNGFVPNQSEQTVHARGHERWQRNENGEHVRNIRSVWTIPTTPFSGAHFATFPPALIRPCILAGTSARGVCGKCGAPWTRVAVHTAGDSEAASRPKRTAGMNSLTSTLSLSGNGSKEWAERGGRSETVGWQPSCKHNGDPIPATVLDPFAGSFTTCKVAIEAGRRAIGIELNPAYIEIGKRRCDTFVGLPF